MIVLLIILVSGSLLSQSTNIDSILISDQDLSEKDFFNSSYKLERWFSSEGNSEGLSDVWLDRYLEPRDINLMNYDDLMHWRKLNYCKVYNTLQNKITKQHIKR